MRSMTLRQTGHLRKALNAIKKAIQLDPNDPKNYVERGIYYDIQYMRGKALADYEHALQLNPNLVDAYIIRAIGYTFLDKAKAFADFKKALSLEPNNMLIYATRADFYIKINEIDNAIADATYALQNGFSIPPVYIILIRAN
ncbi:MAG TPA: hypothetical protein PLZ51_08210, partial [Aggregatilineales bacterium]|nr:hypothetical protein [Aggregatilineales bacterium]